MLQGTVMTVVQFVAKIIERQFPDVKMKIDEPERKNGIYYIDVTRNGKLFTFMWKGSVGFGFWDDAPGKESFGIRPDVIIKQGRGMTLNDPVFTEINKRLALLA